MGWYRVTDGCLNYRRLKHDPFTAWLASPRGAEVVASVSEGLRFSLLGRKRAARRLLWRQLGTILADGRVRAIIDSHARTYQSLLASLAFLEPLPRATVDLRRVVIVPRLLLDARAHELIQEDLHRLIDAQDITGGEALREFLVTTLVDEMDRACVTARPTVGRPLLAGQEWASVRVDLHFTWETPAWTGPSWPGHHFVYERPRERLTLRQGRRLNAAMNEMAGTIDRWPRAKRHETLQRAQRAAHSLGA